MGKLSKGQVSALARESSLFVLASGLMYAARRFKKSKQSAKLADKTVGVGSRALTVQEIATILKQAPSGADADTVAELIKAGKTQTVQSNRGAVGLVSIFGLSVVLAGGYAASDYLLYKDASWYQANRAAKIAPAVAFGVLQAAGGIIIPLAMDASKESKATDVLQSVFFGVYAAGVSALMHEFYPN